MYCGIKGLDIGAKLICKEHSECFDIDDDGEKDKLRGLFVNCVDGSIFSNYINYFIDFFSGYVGLGYYLGEDGEFKSLTEDVDLTELEYWMTTPNPYGIFFDYVDTKLLQKAFYIFKKYDLFFRPVPDENEIDLDAEYSRINKNFYLFFRGH